MLGISNRMPGCSEVLLSGHFIRLLENNSRTKAYTTISFHLPANEILTGKLKLKAWRRGSIKVVQNEGGKETTYVMCFHNC